MLQILLYYLKQYPRVPLEQTTVWYLCWFRLHSSWSRKAFPYKPCLGTDTRQNGAMHSACHRGLFNRQEAVYCLIAGICGQSQLIQEAQILSKKLFEIWSNIMDNLVSFISPPNQICISFEIHTVTQGSSWHDAIIAWWNILGCIREIWLGRYSGPLSSEVVWVWRELSLYWLFFLEAQFPRKTWNNLQFPWSFWERHLPEMGYFMSDEVWAYVQHGRGSVLKYNNWFTWKCKKRRKRCQGCKF